MEINVDAIEIEIKGEGVIIPAVKEEAKECDITGCSISEDVSE